MKIAAGWRELAAPVPPIEEFDAELGFQSLDLRRERRLADVELSRPGDKSA
jgi:hypothetical protein